MLFRAVIVREGGRFAVAPALWADVDIVPERSEWDAVYFGYGIQGRTMRIIISLRGVALRRHVGWIEWVPPATSFARSM